MFRDSDWRHVQSHRLKPDSENATDCSHKPEAAPVSAGAANDPDAELAARAKKGDRAAMALLVERHNAAVSRLLWRFVKTRADLEDLVQDTFLRMVRGLPHWRGQQPFAHWLLRIASNTGRDYFRRQTVRRRWTVDNAATPGDLPEPEAIDPGGDPATRSAANEVKTLLGQLPPDERALLTLHHLEGWSLVDIAAQYGWTITATKLRAWRARRRLRALFKTNDAP
jgi:RNA polymerase sigma-70 factor (ECF subfamily)